MRLATFPPLAFFLIILICRFQTIDATLFGSRTVDKARVSRQTNARRSREKSFPIFGQSDLIGRAIKLVKDSSVNASHADNSNLNVNSNVNFNELHSDISRLVTGSANVVKEPQVDTTRTRGSYNSSLIPERVDSPNRKDTKESIPNVPGDVLRNFENIKWKNVLSKKCLNPRGTFGHVDLQISRNRYAMRLTNAFGNLNTFDAGKKRKLRAGGDTTLCWIETTTIKEDRFSQPPKRLVIKEFTVSFENWAAISDDDIECPRMEGELSPNDEDAVCRTSLKEVIVDDTSQSRVINIAEETNIGPIRTRRRKTIKCAMGSVAYKETYTWPDAPGEPRKRVEIRIAPRTREVRSDACESKKVFAPPETEKPVTSLTNGIWKPWWKHPKPSTAVYPCDGDGVDASGGCFREIPSGEEASLTQESGETAGDDKSCRDGLGSSCWSYGSEEIPGIPVENEFAEPTNRPFANLPTKAPPVMFTATTDGSNVGHVGISFEGGVRESSESSWGEFSEREVYGPTTPGFKPCVGLQTKNCVRTGEGYPYGTPELPSEKPGKESSTDNSVALPTEIPTEKYSVAGCLSNSAVESGRCREKSTASWGESVEIAASEESCDSSGNCDSEIDRVDPSLGIIPPVVTGSDETISCDDSSESCDTPTSWEVSSSPNARPTESGRGVNDVRSITWSTLPSATQQTTDDDHKIGLTIKVSLEHLNGQRESEKLVEFEKHLVLNEGPTDHGNHGLVWRLQSLNNSRNLETFRALFNCSCLENFTEIYSRLTNFKRVKNGGISLEGDKESADESMESWARKKREIHAGDDGKNGRNIAKVEGVKAVSEDPLRVDEDFRNGLGHVFHRLSEEFSGPGSSGAAKVAESSASTMSDFPVGASEGKNDVDRQKRAGEVGKVVSVQELDHPINGEEIDRWSKERFVEAADGGKVRSLLEFNIIRDPT